jgi:hypothetical protein
MGEERWLGREGGLLAGVLPLEDIVSYGRYASCQPEDGLLYEYDLGSFWVTGPEPDRPRKHVEEFGDLPLGPWRHLPLCDCPLCMAQSLA